MIMRSKLVYLVDVIIILTCILGFYQVFQKAALPVIFDHNGLTVENVTTSYSSLMVGDKLISVDAIKLSTQEELEFVLDSKSVNQFVSIKVQRNGHVIKTRENLIRFYSNLYILVQIIVVSVFVSLALFVFTKRKEDDVALIFNWVLLFASLIISTTWGRYTIAPHGLGHLIRCIFNLAYATAAVTFLHFSLIFPSIKYNKILKYMPLLYLIGVLLAVVSSVYFLLAAKNVSIPLFNIYNNLFTATRLYFMLFVLLGLVNVVYTYTTAKEESEKKKLGWVLLGVTVGPLSLISLWIIPQIITSRGIIDEEYVVLTMLSVPIAFTIAIVKYHILNIDQLFKRGTIYAIVYFIVLLIYVIVVSSISLFVGTLTVTSTLIASTIAAVIIAALFNPIKEKTQGVVDKIFFHVNYNYRLAEREFIEKIKFCYDESSLVKAVTETIQFLIPNQKTEISFVGHKSFNMNHNLLEIQKIGEHPIFINEHVEPGAKYNQAEKDYFLDKEIVALFPMHSHEIGLFAVLLLGKKKSGFRFNLEDIDLLQMFCHQTSLAFDRISMQKKLISEQIEKSRLKELNELKSYFVSSVTHELKTPLTSIRMFTEMIEASPNLKKEKREEYLRIIKGESLRLTRLIDNVLDIAKIEKGIKEYRKTLIDINSCVYNVLAIMEYQLDLNGFICETDLYKEEILVAADKDAIEELLINLITNSIKYSAEKKRIIISTKVSNELIELTVEDEGIGIDDKDISKIFEPFERTNSSIAKNTAGTGLGLALVKHISDAHNAKISVESQLGKGSKFTITFPKQTEIPI